MVLHPQARRAVESAMGGKKVFDPAYDIDAARAAARTEAASRAA